MNDLVQQQLQALNRSLLELQFIPGPKNRRKRIASVLRRRPCAVPVPVPATHQIPEGRGAARTGFSAAGEMRILLWIYC